MKKLFLTLILSSVAFAQSSSTYVPGGGGGGGTGSSTNGQILINSSNAVAGASTTGSGSVVLATSPTLATPTLTAPNLGTPSSAVLTNATGLPLSTGTTGTLNQSSIADTNRTTAIASGFYHAYGDSITVGTTNTTSAAYGYAALLGVDLNSVETNNAVNGSQACDNVDQSIFSNENPGNYKNPIYTWQAGTNDANVKGLGSYEAIYQGCHRAGLSWLAISSTYKTFAQACTKTGTWTNYASWASGVASNSTVNGSTLSCSITTYGEPIYIWFREQDGSTSTFNYQVDGGSATSVAIATTPTISTQNSGTTGVGFIRIPVSSAAHTVLFTLTAVDANGVTIAGVGTPDPLSFYMEPRVFVGGVPKQLNDNLSSTTAGYQADSLADTNLLIGDGLILNFVNMRPYMTSNATDMGSNTLHPNNLGQTELLAAYEDAMQYSPFPGAPTAPILVGTASAPTDIQGYSDVNSGALASSSSINQGILLYKASGNAYGIDMGNNGSKFMTRLFAPTGTAIEDCFFTNLGSSTYPSSQSQMNSACDFAIQDNAKTATFSSVKLVSIQSSVPTVSGCGSSPSVSTTATDTKGTITVGSGATGCVLTFKTAYTTTAPSCVVSFESGTAQPYSTSTTAITVTGSPTGLIDYVCIQ